LSKTIILCLSVMNIFNMELTFLTGIKVNTL
jgi:hypothetical protein